VRRRSNCSHGCLGFGLQEYNYKESSLGLLSKDEYIYIHLNIKAADSLNNYFPTSQRRGNINHLHHTLDTLETSITYLKICKWRKLTDNQQQTLIKAFCVLPSSQKKMYRQNLQLLVEGKSSMPLPGATSVATSVVTSVAAVAATSVTTATGATSVATCVATCVVTSVAAILETSLQNQSVHI
jgi:hypothetical protein